jgi:hypothetical protein
MGEHMGDEVDGEMTMRAVTAASTVLGITNRKRVDTLREVIRPTRTVIVLTVGCR